MNTTFQEQASQLMTADPVAVQGNLFLREALSIMADHRITAIPVVDEQQRPIGVLSQSDVIRHLYENPEYALTEVAHFDSEAADQNMQLFNVSDSQNVEIAEVMTPMVYTVMADTSIDKVIDTILERRVHRIYVTNTAGKLSGVISTLDLLQYGRSKR